MFGGFNVAIYGSSSVSSNYVIVCQTHESRLCTLENTPGDLHQYFLTVLDFGGQSLCTGYCMGLNFLHPPFPLSSHYSNNCACDGDPRQLVFLRITVLRLLNEFPTTKHDNETHALALYR